MSIVEPFRSKVLTNVVSVLVDAWESCQGADVLIESPSAMAGVHIAEALRELHVTISTFLFETSPVDIPFFRAFTMPWTK